eukprot:9339156-Pyramimonas_sp.AAC.1
MASGSLSRCPWRNMMCAEQCWFPKISFIAPRFLQLTVHTSRAALTPPPGHPPGTWDLVSREGRGTGSALTIGQKQIF